MKKISFVFVLMMAVCMLLTACGGKSGDDTEVTQPTEAPQISEDLGNELDSFSDEVFWANA